MGVIIKMEYINREMHIHGGNLYHHPAVIDYSANMNPCGMPDRVRDAAIMGIAESCCYPDPESHLLRAQIASYEGMPKEWIFCGNGAAELIYQICMAVKPKKALVQAPAFFEYVQALRAVDCEIQYHFLEEKENFSTKESLLEKLTAETDICFLGLPNNPTGQLIGQKQLQEIVERCREMSIMLVLDACFLEFCEDNAYYCMQKEALQNTNIVILKAFTKLYAMPGLRLGYGISSSDSLLRRIQVTRQPWNVSIPAQYAGIAALKETEYVKHSLQVINQEKNYLLQQLEKYGLTEKIYGHAANYIFFKAQENLGEALLKKGFLIRDCSNFRGLQKGFYRIAVRGHSENRELIRAWKLIKG